MYLFRDIEGAAPGIHFDLVYLSVRDLARLSDRGIEGPPTLAVEIVSPTTGQTDRGTKLELYARHGVAHYWVVDPGARIIEAFRLGGTSGVPVGRLDGLVPVALPPFSDLLLDPAAVWSQ